MKNLATTMLGATCLALSACWTEGDDRSAEEVEQVSDNVARQLEAEAENALGPEEERLEDTADVVRETGEAAAKAIDENDLVLTNGQ